MKEILKPIAKFAIKYGINFLMEYLAGEVSKGNKGNEIKVAVNALGDLVKSTGDIIADGKYDAEEKAHTEAEVEALVDACFAF